MFRIYITNNITYNKTNDIIASIIMKIIIKMCFNSNLVFCNLCTSFYHNNSIVIYGVTIIRSLVSINLNSRRYIFTEHI